MHTSCMKVLGEFEKKIWISIQQYVVDQFKILEKDNEKMRLGLIKEMKEISDKVSC